MKPVIRIESLGEDAVPFPSLAIAMQIAPRHSEAYIATSLSGVHLADAMPLGTCGGALAWQLTFAGRDVADEAGWTCGAPAMSDRDSETVLAVALREDFEQVAS